MNRDKLYGILLIAAAAGLLWLAGAFYAVDLPGGCIVKHTTGIPCPSCGTTRSVVAVLQGDMHAALTLNPLGIPVLLLLFVIPLWVGYDLITGKATLLIAFRKAEARLCRRQVAIPVLLLIAANWFWNIYKGL